MARYLTQTSTKRTLQSEPILGSDQVENSAGGYAWAVDDWTRLERFLILGTEGGSYYASEPKLTREAAEAVLRCIKADGPKAVARIVEISEAARAARQSPGLFALALCAAFGDERTKHSAYLAVPLVCRTGSTLMEWTEYTNSFMGWPMGKRKAVERWFLGLRPRDLAYQVVKYRERNGWSVWDLLRSSHPWPRTTERSGPLTEQGQIMGWVAGKIKLDEQYGWSSEVKDFLMAYEQLLATTNPRDAAVLIQAHRLPRECVPTKLLTEQVIWEALLEDMPVGALIRNLAMLTRRGVLAPFSPAIEKVLERMSADNLKRGRVHPLQVLGALLTYKNGESVRGSATWDPVPQVIDGLDKAFYDAFGAVEPTGRRTLIAIDGSGSMAYGDIAGLPGLTPRLGAVALALVTANVEKNYNIIAYTISVKSPKITPRMRLDAAMSEFEKIVKPEGTDCSLPMVYAQQQKWPVDLFVNLTDNETWTGSIHPGQALNEYRRTLGIRSKMVVVGMIANEFSVADQDDAGQLDVVGFDLNVPTLISEFVRGD